MPSGRNAAFLRSLAEHQLLEPAQLAELELNPLAQGDDLPALGKVILQKGWLTRFQINLVGQGKAKDLLLGPYRLIDRLGEGGMGQVFKAHHQPMNRTVALKVIRKEKLASPQAVQRFFREVQAAAKLVHPNIVLAFDAGQVEKTYYFAMEYVDGIDLAKLVKQNGPLPEKAACDYIRQAALGLQHAHEQGMIHRDIKPHNLLLSRVNDTSTSRSTTGSASKASLKDVVKILDMGLARLQSSTPTDHSITQEGAVVGTPDYIAPEQALDARRVDGRSDLYSLGGVFFYLLTGRPPFSGGTLAELLLKHQMEVPPDVRQLRPEISADTTAIVAHLLAKRPEERFQSPVDLAQALEPLIQGSGALAWSRSAEPNAFSELGGSVDSPSSATLAQPRSMMRPKPAQPTSSKKLLIGGGALAAVLLLGLIIFLLIPKGQGDAPGQRDGDRIAIAPTGKSLPPTAAVGPPAMADFTLMPVGPLTIKGGENKSLQIKVERQGLGGKPIQVRLVGLPAGVIGDAAVLDGVQDSVQIKLEAQANVTDLQKDVQVVASNGTVEMSASFRLTVQGGAVAVAPLPPPMLGQARATLQGHSQSVSSVAFSPDGRSLASGSYDHTIKLWDLASGQQKATFRGHTSSVKSVTFSPDGGTLASAGTDKTIKLWDVASGQEKSTLQGLSGEINSVAISPDGRALVSGGALDSSKLWELPAGQPKATFRDKDAALFSVSFSPDGRTFAAGMGNGMVKLWDVVTGQQTAAFKAHAVLVNCVAFSPDGRTLASCSADRTVKLLNPATGQEKATLQANNPINSIAFSPDGRVLASGSANTINIWDVTTQQEMTNLRGHTSLVNSVAISPDGRTLASASTDKTVKLWDLTPPAEVGVKPPPPGPLGDGEPQRLTPGPTNPRAYYGWFLPPDGRRVLALDSVNQGTLWDTENGTVARTVTLAFNGTSSGVLSADGQLLFRAESRTSNLVHLLDPQTGRLVRSVQHPFPNPTVAMTPNGQRGLTTSSINRAKVHENCAVRVWDLQTGQEIAQLDRPGEGVQWGALAPDGRRAATVTSAGDIALWDVDAGRVLATQKSYSFHCEPAFSPDGKRLVGLCFNNRIRVWETGALRMLHDLVIQDGSASRMALSPDGKYLLICNASYRTGPDKTSVAVDPTVRLWDLEAGRELKRLSGHTQPVVSVAFAPDGSRGLGIGADGRVICIWHLGLALPAAVKPPVAPPTADGGMVQLTGHTDKVTVVAISPDGKKALSGSADRTLKIWDLEMAKESSTLKEHSDEVQLIGWSADGRRALSASADGNVCYWDLELHSRLKSSDLSTPLRSLSLDVKDAAFFWTTPDGRIGRTTVPTNTTEGGGDGKIYRVVLRSPDGTRFLTGCDDGSLRVLERMPTGAWQQRANLPGHTGPISALAVSGDGKRAVTGSADNRLRLYDLGQATYKYGRILDGHPGKVTAVAMSSDGHLVLSGGEDKTLRLWDADTGKEVRRFPDHPNGITGAAMSPDGRFVISACGDKILRLWDLKATKP